MIASMRSLSAGVLAVLPALVGQLLVAESPVMEPSEILPVWPDAIPADSGTIGPERVRAPAEAPSTTAKWITNVTRPTLSVFRPVEDKNSGIAVVICPGGGYWNLAWDLDQGLPDLPDGDRGIAARYPDDLGIAGDPAVLFHDDFESGDPRSRWDNVFHRSNLLVTEVPEHVHRGMRALEFRVPRQQTEVANAVIKRLEGGYDRVFLRYYSKFDPAFDQTGSSHNGGFLAAIAPGVPFATPGLRADGRNKFMVSFENWRANPQEPSPGRLNVYCYHPEQRTEYGDHFFPSGEVLPFSSRPGSFGPYFVARPEIVPALGRWYCHEIMLEANTVGERDGRIACWLDGRLIADFPNLRLREVETLKINFAALDLHIKSNPIRENRKWYDDVVIATSYIGPITHTR